MVRFAFALVGAVQPAPSHTISEYVRCDGLFGCSGCELLAVPGQGVLTVQCPGGDRRGRAGLCAPGGCGYGTGVGRSASAGTASGVHGFPAALTSFVGRAGPVREVAGLLEERRLVTVTGPGGSGKTRLAVEVARRVAGRFADGTWLAELAPVADPAVVAIGGGGGLGGTRAAGGAGRGGGGAGAGPRSSCCWCWITASR